MLEAPSEPPGEVQENQVRITRPLKGVNHPMNLTMNPNAIHGAFHKVPQVPRPRARTRHLTGLLTRASTTPLMMPFRSLICLVNLCAIHGAISKCPQMAIQNAIQRGGGGFKTPHPHPWGVFFHDILGSGREVILIFILYFARRRRKISVYFGSPPAEKRHTG